MGCASSKTVDGGKVDANSSLPAVSQSPGDADGDAKRYGVLTKDLEAEIESTFKKIDKDSNGFLTGDELKDVVAKYSGEGFTFDEKQFFGWFDIHGANGGKPDSKLDLKEFGWYLADIAESFSEPAVAMAGIVQKFDEIAAAGPAASPAEGEEVYFEGTDEEQAAAAKIQAGFRGHKVRKEMSKGQINTAFVFIKPHAVTDATKKLVTSSLSAAGISVLSEGKLTGEQIDEGKLIDQHYYAIASKATILKPAQLNVPNDKFEAQFGLEWQAALDSGKVLNALDGCAALGITADEMDTQWGICKKAKKLVKFGGGFYCGLIEIEGKESYYIFNGFFMSMRSKFTAPGTSIYYYVVEWDAAKTSWGDFRGKVLGPTDPTEAPEGSIRGQIYAKWEALGLEAVPDVGDNGVHASASPFEALAERANWVKADLATDAFGAQLIAAGISLETIKSWTIDPQVLVDGAKGSLFDSVEDINSADCIAKLTAINTENK